MSIQVDSRYLQVLFEGHGLSCDVVDGWVLPEGRRPAIRAEWYPNRNGFSGVFNVRVLMPDGVEFQEACSGMGTGDEGIDNGFVKSTENAFHVLLAALWRRDQDEQVHRGARYARRRLHGVSGPFRGARQGALSAGDAGSHR
ncbi:DUF6348 family protein [Massilia sp. CCM 8734]|uniref:DUF6348 family protein n=1 Tax=Massilia sp. CCM 8734 TaxID=2609283 RepID=UPI00141F305F|nr:hypothetical protein [Massilia sp. CCM 8734]